jgi:signal transduction histidine kinase
MSERHSLDVALDIRADFLEFSEEVRILLFQMVRELLFNVVKHAGVMSARLILFEQEQSVIIQVIDTGRGFEEQELVALNDGKGAGFGLYSLRKRIALLGGQFRIETYPGAGVCATILFPRELVGSPLPVDPRQ